MDLHEEKILILDFGSQYTQLIARKIREIGIYCEIRAYDIQPDELNQFAPNGIVLSGGPESATENTSVDIPEHVFSSGVPVLGICYGMQAMASQLGGKVEESNKKEFGFANVKLERSSDLLGSLGDTENSDHSLDVWMSHGDKVASLPAGFSVIGSSNNSPIAIMADEKRKLYGLQFHPEVDHTAKGKAILDRFVKVICGCKAIWTPGNIANDLVKKIRDEVGDKKVLLGLSGGVDSSVVASLLARAIGSQLTCVFVNNGLLRSAEVEQVEAMVEQGLRQKVSFELKTVNEESVFFKRLSGVNDPEEKRKIIGQTFIEVFEREAAKIRDVEFLAQGTIYPDVIESAGKKNGKAHVIKSHHNVGGLPAHMKLRLLEPLRELFKDEVRTLGLELGLPAEMVFRHPFPGPGLAVRVLGEVRKDFVCMLRLADQIFMEEMIEAGFYKKVSQAFVVFLPVKSVGVVGDSRRYEYVVSLRAVETLDFMTATWSRLPYEFLDLVSRRIMNEVSGISRVTYDISSKPPSTIEWE